MSFHSLPPELLAIIFSFVDSFQTHGSLSSTCKIFRSHLEDPVYLKNLCMRWWNESGHASKGFDLIFAHNAVSKFESSRSWKWFARCFNRDGKLATLLREDGETRILFIGEVEESKLDGFGLQLTTKNICAGYFRKDILEGEGIAEGDFDGGTLVYQGEWAVGQANGKGVCTWLGKRTYNGEWEKTLRHGKGKYTWDVIGFSFEGEWSSNRPVDEELCVPRSIVDCIQDGQCTLKITKKLMDYPQLMYKCKQCKKLYCGVCKESCHAEDHHVHRQWYEAIHCDCETHLCAMEEEEGPPTKRRKY